MNELQPILALRDVKLVARMRDGWKFGYSAMGYFAENDQQKEARVWAESLDELLTIMDTLNSQTIVKNNRDGGPG
jgi:hypothetical protein